MRRILPYLCVASLLTSGYAQGTSLSQRAVELSAKATNGCVTEYGTMNSTKNGTEERAEFKKDGKVTGFEKKNELFTFFVGNDISMTRYVTTFSEDKVGIKAIEPSTTRPILGIPALIEEWTAEYRSQMEKFLAALKDCAK